MFEGELGDAQDYEGASPWLGDHTKESKDASCAAPEGLMRHLVGLPSSQTMCVHPDRERAVYPAVEGKHQAGGQRDPSSSQTRCPHPERQRIA